MSKKLQSPDAIRALLLRRFGNQHQAWLAGDGSWPMLLPLGVPTERDIAADASAVRAWAAAWQSWAGPGEVVFEDRHFPRLGRQRLPVGLSFAAPGDVAAVVGQAGRWAIATRRFQGMLERWPALAQGAALASRFDVLADYADDDFERLVALLGWLDANPASDLYIRQLPVEGLDTKWLEKRLGLVSGLLRAVRGASDGAGDFHAIAGLRRPSHRVRLRLLCPALRARVGGLGDIEAPVDELAELPLSPSAVIIVENRETGLALPEFAGTLVIMGLGNAVAALKSLPWLTGVRAFYWGDIDTHGFAILDRARKAVPQLRSVLMDHGTLRAHRKLWVQEPVQCPDLPLDAMTVEERAVYDGLRADTWGPSVRLEQERIAWHIAIDALQAIGNGAVIVPVGRAARRRGFAWR